MTNVVLVGRCPSCGLSLRSDICVSHPTRFRVRAGDFSLCLGCRSLLVCAFTYFDLAGWRVASEVERRAAQALIRAGVVDVGMDEAKEARGLLGRRDRGPGFRPVQ